MLESYCWPFSVRNDDCDGVGLCISSSNGSYRLDIYEGGDVDCLVYTADGSCGSYEIPANAYSHGCGWPVTARIPTSGWKSSFYLVKVSSGSETTEAFFVVLPSVQKSPLLFVLSTSTWNAYNDWGDGCLYDDICSHQVSFERPVAKGFLSKLPHQNRRKANPLPGDKDTMYFSQWTIEQGLSYFCGASGWWNWERVMFYWLKRNGFSCDIATSNDLHADPTLLLGHKLFLSVGHDEYWSWDMRDHLDAFVTNGGHVCMLSGNSCFWQIRYERSDNSRMICYKYYPEKDPFWNDSTPSAQQRISGHWSHHRIGRPEQSTIGLSFTKGGYSRFGHGVPRGCGGYTIYQHDHWIFEGTGLCYGDVIGSIDAICAYEVDGCEFEMKYGVPLPTYRDGAPEGMIILGIAPARLWLQHEQPDRYGDDPGEMEAVARAIHGEEWEQHLYKYRNNHCCLVLHEGNESRGMLFNAGCVDWTVGIENNDPDIVTITKNILLRMTTSP
jgi:hypothetical protein